jgi:hypothetical protein
VIVIVAGVQQYDISDWLFHSIRCGGIDVITVDITT